MPGATCYCIMPDAWGSASVSYMLLPILWPQKARQPVSPPFCLVPKGGFSSRSFYLISVSRCPFQAAVYKICREMYKEGVEGVDGGPFPEQPDLIGDR